MQNSNLLTGSHFDSFISLVPEVSFNNEFVTVIPWIYFCNYLFLPSLFFIFFCFGASIFFSLNSLISSFQSMCQICKKSPGIGQHNKIYQLAYYPLSLDLVLFRLPYNFNMLKFSWIRTIYVGVGTFLNKLSKISIKLI